MIIAGLQQVSGSLVFFRKLFLANRCRPDRLHFRAFRRKLFLRKKVLSPLFCRYKIRLKKADRTRMKDTACFFLIYFGVYPGGGFLFQLAALFFRQHKKGLLHRINSFKGWFYLQNFTLGIKLQLVDTNLTVKSSRPPRHVNSFGIGKTMINQIPFVFARNLDG